MATVEPTDLTPEIVDTDEFTYGWSGWSSESEAEKRKAITAKLKEYNIGIATSPLDAALLEEVGADGEAADGEVQIEGVAVVRVHYGGASDTKTGEIKQGEPVCFDMVTGDAVTGVNEAWADDEYFVVGIALMDFSETTNPDATEFADYKRIAIKMQPPATAASEAGTWGVVVSSTDVRYTDDDGKTWTGYGYFYPLTKGDENGSFPGRFEITVDDSNATGERFQNYSDRNLWEGAVCYFQKDVNGDYVPTNVQTGAYAPYANPTP